MNQLIAELTQKLGIDESTANAATGTAMKMLRENIGDDLFGKINQAAPEVAGLADQAPAAAAQSSGGGLMGSLASMAAGALGGEKGNALELGTALSASGLSLEQVGPFLTTLVGFLKQYLGEEVVDQILSKFPMLKQLLGD